MDEVHYGQTEMVHWQVCSQVLSGMEGSVQSKNTYIHTYEPADADGPAIWTSTYDADGKDDDFDAQDIQDYVVDKKDGKSPPDGGRAAKQRADELSKWGGEVAMAEPKPEPEPRRPPPPCDPLGSTWNQLLYSMCDVGYL
eukprot:COSAG01_NODE_2958_length_6794_cov_420.552054_6_plen_140_part_00